MSTSPPAPRAEMPANCANCGQALGDPRPRFCPACGQETHIKPPTLGEFLQQFGGAYFSTEGALWRTLKLLLLKPGELTAQYLAGRRKHYVLPLRLYLTISVLVLLLARVLGSSGAVQVNIGDEMQKPGARPRTFTILGLGEAGQGIGFRDGSFYCNTVPQWVCKRVGRRFGDNAQVRPGELDDFTDRMLANVGGGMFLMLPSFALLMKLVYLNRRLRYTEHLVFALHLHAYWFLALLLTLPRLPMLSGLVFIALPVYTFKAMRRVYGGRLWPRLLRGSLVALLYGVVLTVALVVVALWSLIA